MPAQGIDYDALAQQARTAKPSTPVDYDALANQARGQQSSAPFPGGPVPGAASGLPGIPPPPLPQDLQKSAQPQEQAMQQSMGGPPQMVNVPQGQGPAFTQAGQEGAQTGGKIGAGMLAAMTPISTLSGMATGYGTGKAAKYGAKKLGAGPAGQETAEDIGQLGGSVIGYGIPGLLKRGIQSLAYGGGQDLTPAAKLLFHHPAEAIFKAAVPPMEAPPAAGTPKLNPFEGATSTAEPVGTAEVASAFHYIHYEHGWKDYATTECLIRTEVWGTGERTHC